MRLPRILIDAFSMFMSQPTTSTEELNQIHILDKTDDRLSDNTELQQSIQDVTLAVEILPPRFRGELWTHPELLALIELVMDYGRRPIARFSTGDYPLSDATIDFDDLDSAIKSVGQFGDDNRTGIEGTLHRVSCMRDRHDRIYGLTIRIGRAVTTKTAGLVIDPLASGQSVLLLGPPGVGKTSAIRSFCRLLADDLKKRVVIVDTSNEIAGHGLIPHPAVGSSRRMQLKHRADQHHIMVEAVQNHMPQVIVIDEIGKKEECQAAKSISQRGVQLLATTHARTLEDVIKDPVLRELVGGVSNVTIGDVRASQTKSNKKTIPERASASSFNVIVEMADRTQWRIHYDTDSAVDAILAGNSPRAEIRSLDEAGNMSITDEFRDSGVFVRGQTRAKIRRPLVKLEPTHDESDISQPLLSKVEETIQQKNEFDVTARPSSLQANTTTLPSIVIPTTQSPESDSVGKGTPNTYNSDAINEAERILNASTDHEVLQAEDNASRGDLRNCYNSIFQKIEGSENEAAILKTARHRLFLAYSTLLRYHSHEEIKNSADINANGENNANTENQTSNDPKFLEAARIMSTTSNLDVLEAKDGASGDELKECLKKVMSRIAKTTNEDDHMRESRNRVRRAYKALLPSTNNTTVIIPVKDARLMEAKRIINASSDLEILQVNAGASREELAAAINAVNKKIMKTKDEDGAIKEARRLVLEAHFRLLYPNKKNKAVAAKGTESSAKTTTGGTPGAILVEKWVADI